MNLEVNPIQFLVSGGPSFIVFPHSLSFLSLFLSTSYSHSLVSLSHPPPSLSVSSLIFQSLL